MSDNLPQSKVIPRLTPKSTSPVAVSSLGTPTALAHQTEETKDAATTISTDYTTPRSAPPIHVPPSSNALESHRPVWLRDVIACIKRRKGNIKSEVVNAGAEADIKAALMDGFMALVFMNGCGDSEALDKLEKALNDGTNPRLVSKARSWTPRLDIMEYLRGIRATAGADMMKKMIQEVRDMGDGKAEEAAGKTEGNRGNACVKEQRATIPNDTGDRANGTNHIDADERGNDVGRGEAQRSHMLPTGHQAPQAIISGGFRVIHVYSKRHVFVTDNVTGQIRSLEESEQEWYARQEHRRRIEEEAQRVAAQARRVAEHATLIAEHNRRIAEHERMMAEQLMAEQSRREAEQVRAWNAFQVFQAGLPHNFNYAPSFQSVNLNAPSQVSYQQVYHPQPAHYGQVPVGYAQHTEPPSGYLQHPQVAYYMPVAWAQTACYGVPPLEHHQHYEPEPAQTTRFELLPGEREPEPDGARNSSKRSRGGNEEEVTGAEKRRCLPTSGPSSRG